MGRGNNLRVSARSSNACTSTTVHLAPPCVNSALVVRERYWFRCSCGRATRGLPWRRTATSSAPAPIVSGSPHPARNPAPSGARPPPRLPRAGRLTERWRESFPARPAALRQRSCERRRRSERASGTSVLRPFPCHSCLCHCHAGVAPSAAKAARAVLESPVIQGLSPRKPKDFRRFLCWPAPCSGGLPSGQARRPAQPARERIFA